MRASLILLFLGLLISCNNAEKKESQDVFITPLGLKKSVSSPSTALINKYRTAQSNYEAEPNNPDNIIWYGRRTAYLGEFSKAIAIYTEGIEKFPNNPKFYRHRGHRYISIREYNKAVADLEKAAELIKGKSNEIEPDGMPNDRNIPVSSLHGNIYYHLGLAYYLLHNYEKAYNAYLKCRNTANNPDNIVSSTHWLYMIQQRLKRPDLADSTLAPIEIGFDVIENHDYYKLCLLYKGLLPLDSINPSDDSPSSDALKYGLANWYFYNDDKNQARRMFNDMMAGQSWTSFGYLAAESDLLEYFSE